MKNKKLVGSLVIVFVLSVLVFGFAIQKAFGATEHEVPDYAQDEYVVGTELLVKTQQICISPESHNLPVDWGFPATGVVIHTISSSGRAFSGTLDVGRLASWDYQTTNVETYNTVWYSNTGDLLSVALNDSAIRITLESPECLFRFPRLTLVEQSQEYMNIFVPMNTTELKSYPLPK